MQRCNLMIALRYILGVLNYLHGKYNFNLHNSAMRKIVPLAHLIGYFLVAVVFALLLTTIQSSFAQSSSHSSEACSTVSACIDLGRDLRREKRFSEAIDAYDRALSLLNPSEDPELAATIYNNRGVTFYEQTEEVPADQKDRLLTQAAEDYREAIRLDSTPIAYINLVSLLSLARRWDDVIEIYHEFEREVLPRIETLPLGSEEETIQSNPHELYLDLSDSTSKNQTYYEYYINQLMVALPSCDGGIEPPACVRYIEPGVRREERALEINERARVRGFLELLDRAEINEVRETDPRYSEINPPISLRIEEIHQLLDEDTLLLEYSLGTIHSYLWIVSNSGEIKSYELPNRAEIETAAQDFYKHLTEPSYRVRPNSTVNSGMTLSHMLFGKAVEQLGNKRLLIVADGWLHYIPFEALPQPCNLIPSKPCEIDWNDLPDPLLIEHEIVNIPSASALVKIRDRSENHALPPEQLALIIDESLSGAVKETDAIQKEAEGENLIAVSVKADLVGEELSKYRIIHFATHGILNDEDPSESGLGLPLALGQDNRQYESNLLKVSEVFQLDLPADLVVLSGCRTGLGSDVQGEGLIGLTRGFMYAGAERVIVSLWSVNDEATARLMERFYNELLDYHKTAPNALREAQLELMDDLDSIWETPYYWAAFVLQGEWSDFRADL